MDTTVAGHYNKIIREVITISNGVLLHREARDAVLKQRYNAELLHRIDQILLGTDDKIKPLFHVFTAFRTSITEQPALRKGRTSIRGPYALHESKLCAP